MDIEVQYKSRNWVPISIKISSLQYLKQFARELKGPWRRVLEERYGKSLDVQLEALMALVQFYDAPLRCFTFRDFQLAPTLEEYERIMGMPVIESSVYFHMVYYSSWAYIARLIKRSEPKVIETKRNRNGVEGLPRSYLEKRLSYLLKEEDWPTTVDILGLLIYGIVLFPHIEGYVDLAVISSF
ncbi:hypothetical protein CR513_22055, partial [Mucuna pruriens]